MSSTGIMQSSIARFNSIINTCRDILRKEGITGMDSMKHLTLYILARRLDKNECKRLSIPERFAWDNFMNLYAQDKRQECLNLLCNPSGDDLIYNLDTMFGTRNFNFKLKGVDAHKSLIKHINEINLNELEDSIDILGTVYENHLGSGSNKSAMRDLGQFFTNRIVCTYMTRLCVPKVFDDGTAESVLDPTMGTGGFLTTYANHLKNLRTDIQWDKMHDAIAGYDIDEFVMSVGKINMYLSTGVLFKRIDHRDTLQNDVGELHERLKFKIILANMPFGVKGLKFADSCKRVKEIKCDGTKSEPLFLNLMMAALDDGGRCAVVVPDGVLVNNSNQHSSTRKYLLDHFALKRVIKMKGQFFSNTGIQPSILFFENTGRPTQSVEFWEVEQSSDGGIIEKMVLSVPRSKFDDACSLDMRRYQEVAAVANTGGYPIVKLEDIVEFKNGKNIPERDRNETGTYPYYASNGISGFVEKSIFEGPSVLLGDQGSAWHKSHHFVKNGVKFYAGNHTIVMKPKNTSLDIKYLYYHLLLNDLQNFNKCAALIPELDKERFYSTNMILPPISIQQEIVTALDLIYNNAATAKVAADYVKAQMVTLVKSMNARGYEQKKLGEVCDLLSGKGNNYQQDGDAYPYYDSNGVTGTRKDFCFDGDHIITARKMSIGAVHFATGKFWSSDNTINIRVKDTSIILSRFFYYWLHLNNQVLKDLSSGIKPGIRKSDVAEILMPVPPIEFQHEVLAMLNEMEAELQTLEQMAAKAEQRAKFILDGYLTPANQAVEAEPSAEPVLTTTMTTEEAPKKRKFKVKQSGSDN